MVHALLTLHRHAHISLGSTLLKTRVAIRNGRNVLVAWGALAHRKAFNASKVTRARRRTKRAMLCACVVAWVTQVT
jgi:hypothetical protein